MLPGQQDVRSVSGTVLEIPRWFGRKHMYCIDVVLCEHRQEALNEYSFDLQHLMVYVPFKVNIKNMTYTHSFSELVTKVNTFPVFTQFVIPSSQFLLHHCMARIEGDI